ncbi:7782_t:CDS:2, partial [Funneliformis geosporum]
ELEILEGEFEPNTKQGKKIASLLRTLKKVQVNLRKTKLDDDSEEIYCQSIEEMQENHVDEISQLDRHLSILLKWSVINSKLFEIPATPPTILRPALHFHNLKVVLEEYPDLQANNILDALLKNKKIEMVATWYQIQMKGCHLSETHVKIQMWSKFLSDSFVLNQIRFEPTWKLNHLFSENVKKGFEVHKDFAVVVCEDVFELNKILVRTQSLLPEEIIQIKVHVGLIIDISINLGVIRPIFNNDKTA